jgi:protein-glutamine gamma-glutamyltransferase
MARVYQVPRHAFPWLIAGAILASLPHLWFGPLWLKVVVPVLLGWRLIVQYGRLSMPGKLVRSLVLMAVLAATLWTFGTLLGPEAGVSLLVAAFALKTLEMFRLRDAYVVIILACFVVATTFLFTIDPLTSIYNVLVLVIVVAALVGINHPESGVSSWYHLRKAGTLVTQALPLMVVLFLLVPRLPPLWGMPLAQGQARTGMSDSMAPGEISRLSQSTEPAFRVEFDGPVPPPAQRYWRGLTYSWFDGRRWSQAVPQALDRDEYVYYPGKEIPGWYRSLIENRGQPQWRYRVVLEPTRQRWLYALSVPFTEKPGVGLARDMRLVRDSDIDTPFDYRVDSYRLAVSAEGLQDWERRFFTTLPPGASPRAAAMAKQWRAEAESDEALIQQILGWFRAEPFYYTLEPPLLGEHTVDDFLFRTRRGFCEHYASSFAFMLRAAGVPSRIVAGYQGGEMNPLGSHLLIRQLDAHVWVEAWLPGRGWVEFDPTAAVAPSRIEMGLDQALADFGEVSLVSALRNNPLLARLSYLADYIEFGWAKWVIGYSQQRQLEFLGRWLGELTPGRMALALAAGVATVMLVIVLWVLWRGRGPQLTWWQREYARMVKLLRRRGVVAADGLTPSALVDQGAARWPQAAALLKDWQHCYERVAYRPHGTEDQRLHQQLVLLRRKLARRLPRAG